jgi:hypothetical protein
VFRRPDAEFATAFRTFSHICFLSLLRRLPDRSRRLTLLFTQSQPDWFGAVFPKSHGRIFDLYSEPVNFIFKSLHGIFDRIPCPWPAHFWLVITVCKRQSDFVFCGFVIWPLQNEFVPVFVENGHPLENKNPSDPIEDVQIFRGNCGGAGPCSLDLPRRFPRLVRT